ncbi:hypothetical protein PMIN06_007244 [Paraphaeosphaeria minitans]
MMFWTSIGCGICMLVYIVLTTLPESSQNVGTNWSAVAMIMLYMVVFGFGWLGPPWIYGPEIALLKYRHVAGGLAACGEWLSTWVIVFGGGTGIEAVDPKIFIWPLINCFIAAAYVWFCCPETTGRTLEEINYLFARKRVCDRMDQMGIGAAGDMRRHSLQSIEKRTSGSCAQHVEMADSSSSEQMHIDEVKFSQV